MGVYLSSPVTEKESIDGECERFVYGASSMQGWRITQEDAHNCIPLFDEKTQTSFFAVYDGHGGSEVAKYCEKHFPDFVKKLIETAESNTDDPTTFIKNAFLAFDATLTSEEVIKKLKELAGKDDDNEEEEEDDPVGYSETDMLKKEADMPLDQLLAQYKSYVPDKLVNSHNKELFQSPALRAKFEAASGDGNAGEGTGSSSVTSSSSPSSCKQNSSPALANGAGDFNVSNTSDQSQTKDTISKNFHSSEKHMNNNNSIDDNITSNCNSISSSTTDGPSSPSSSNKAHTEATGTQHGCELSDGGSQAVVTSGSLSSQTDCSVSGSLPSAADSGDGPSGSGVSSSVGIKSRKAKAAVDTVDGVIDSSDDDDDDDEDEVDVWEDMSDDEDEEDEEEEEDEPDDDVPMMDMSNEEPGSDSGCTACVVLMKDKKLFVANAGDSRCVLSKGGKAVDMSYDHKPEDDSERERIENAGGKVTADGRVNGGLNLSRAIGDHVYKRNKDLGAEEQMITALPDVETAELSEEDQFIVIACDGIWNYMSSQEVVDYILEKLKEPENRQKPSLICEQLFDHCLAPNTCGDGTGCDNMTCIIIVLNTFTNSLAQHAPPPQAAQTEATADNNRDDMTSEQQLSGLNKTEVVSSGSLKRCTDSSEIREGKRLKVTEEAA